MAPQGLFAIDTTAPITYHFSDMRIIPGSIGNHDFENENG